LSLMNTLAEIVSDDECLARFLLNKKYIRKGKMKPHHAAFVPYSRVELSVSRIDGIEENEIWKLGERVVEMRSDNVRLFGRAELQAFRYRQKEYLDVIKDEPPPRHAIVKGWPDIKAKQKMIALELAEDARLICASQS